MDRAVSIFGENLFPNDWSTLEATTGYEKRMARSRVLALVALALAGMFVPGLPHRWYIVAFLVLLAPLNLLGERLVPAAHTHVARVAHDHSVALVLVAIIPMLWPAAAILVVANVIWWVLRPPTLYAHLVIAMSLAGLLVVGVAHRPTGWLPASVMALVLATQYRWLSGLFRRNVEASEEDLSQALSTAGALVHITRVTTAEVISVAGDVEQVTGWPMAAWRQLDRSDLIHPEDRTGFSAPPRTLAPGDVLDRTFRVRRPDGTYGWLRDVARVVEQPNGELYLRGFTLDVSAIQDAHQVIRRQAKTDELTGLANRSVITATLDHRLRAKEPLVLFMLDLDRFKHINDALGHAFGDQVLMEIAHRLRTLLDPDDVVVRLSGDEFAVVVAGLDSERDAASLAERIALDCSRVMSPQGVSISTSVSIGVALAPRHGDDQETLMRHADLAMYEAKREGRSFRIFDAEIEQAPLADLTLSASIAGAIESGEFVLHYQPKVDLITGAVTGFEGLARWQHPEFGTLGPNRFVHLVTMSDHSRRFTDYVIAAGVAFAARCRAAGHPIPVAVNVSARSLFDDSLADRTAAVLHRYDLPPRLLVIELTEHDIMDKAGRSSVLPRLAALGVQISIDDFGTGYSSLARLADLPITEIKIDRRFVSRATHDPQDEVIVRSIIDLARNLQLHVVAEGVESPNEAALLVRAGCGEAQGYLYSKPVPENEAAEMLLRSLLPGGPPIGADIGAGTNSPFPSADA